MGILNTIGNTPLIEITRLLNGNGDVRVLAKLEGNAKPAIPQIRGLLQADSRTIREAAALALQKVGQR